MRRKRIYIFLLLVSTLNMYAQTDELNQFWHEYAFTKDLSQKWALELNMGLTTSSTAEDNNIFYNLTGVSDYESYMSVWFGRAVEL